MVYPSLHNHFQRLAPLRTSSDHSAASTEGRISPPKRGALSTDFISIRTLCLLCLCGENVFVPSPVSLDATTIFHADYETDPPPDSVCQAPKTAESERRIRRPVGLQRSKASADR